ncbi:hypothetical protein [Pollutibacter soli]|uniref:hypothetical protein n=1 Tax=Pollutibacter soli TaxID=3034157 RepID=UPI0030134C9D
MQENKPGIGEGILRGLKKIIFTGNEAPSASPEKPVNVAPVQEQPKIAVNNETAAPSSDMKLRVYQLLEKMNRPGCDFFEVWNASVEMGGVNSNNIKAAYTSLRFADPTLNRAKLEESGNFYMTELRKILDAETAKRQEEKAKLEKDKEQFKSNLTIEINRLEQEIASLKEKLEAKKLERQNIDENFQPRLSNIEDKIREGGASVNIVLAEMQEVRQIIQQVIN